VDVVEVAATQIEALIADVVVVLEVVGGAEDEGLQVIWMYMKKIGISLLMPCISSPETGVMPPRDVGGGCQVLITRTITRDTRLLYRRPPFPAGTVLDMAAVGGADISAQTHQEQRNVRRNTV
jgi:hypothetical protein